MKRGTESFAQRRVPPRTVSLGAPPGDGPWCGRRLRWLRVLQRVGPALPVAWLAVLGLPPEILARTSDGGQPSELPVSRGSVGRGSRRAAAPSPLPRLGGSLALPGSGWLGLAAGPRGISPSPEEPQRVLVASLEAFAAGEQVLVRWETALEAGVISYDLYRFDDGQRLKVNAAPVVAVNALTGGRYFVRDTAASSQLAHRYELDAFLITGRSVMVAGQELTATTPVAEDSLTPQGSGPRAPTAPVREPQTGRRPALAATPEAVNLAAADSTAAVKIRTSAVGMHFLSAGTLGSLLGMAEAEVAGWITTGSLGMSNRGEPVVYVPGTSSTGPGLFFYAEPNRNNYTYENVYWLQRGNNRFTSVDGGNPDPPANPGSYRALAEAEQDAILIISVISDPEADFWAWRGLIAGHSVLSTWSTDFPLTSVVQSAGVSTTLRVRVVGGTRTSHLLEAQLNGVSLGQRSWSGLTSAVVELSVPSTLLRNATTGQGDNRLTLTALLGSGVTASQVYVDGYELEYPRNFRAAGNYLEASASGHSLIMAEGFTGTSITVLEITDPRNPKVVTNVRTDAVGTNRRATFRSSPGGRYALFRPSVAVATTAVGSDRLSLAYPANLRNPATRASYVLVAPAAFAAAAEQLAAYRASRLRTKVVLLEDIYNEFSHGLVTPHAIAQFVRTAYLDWSFPIRFLVLIGDGTYDYRNLETKNDNFLPPLMIRTDFGLFTSDSLFGNVMEDDMMRVAVGRIPLVTSAEMAAVLAKMESYESRTQPLPRKALLVADRPDAAGDFVANITALETYFPAGYISQKVYPPPYPVGNNPPPIDVSAMRAGVQAGLNEGVQVMHYVGHGAYDRFGKDKYLHVADVPALSNASRLPLVVAMTCVAGQYSSPGSDCLGEVLLMTPSVGAVAAVAPTGLSYDDDASWISRRIMQVLARTTSGHLGDIVMQAFSLYNSETVRDTPVWMYNLLGDPALTLYVPTP